MSWRLVTPVIALLACGQSDKSKLDSAGPVFSPSIANALRGVAPDCKLEKTPTRQTRDCRGRFGSVKIELESDHFSTLTIALQSMILIEAKSVFGPPLQHLFGAAGRDQILAAVAKLESGQTADLTVGGSRIAVAATGPVAMPEYKLSISW